MSPPEQGPSLYLKALGFTDIRDADGGSRVGLLRRPKQVALLSALALAAPGLRTRDGLLDLLWPGPDREKARRALNQAVHELKTELGDVVVRNGEQLGIAEGALASDVDDLRAAAEAGDHGEVVFLYRGDLLDGLMLSGAPAFHRWLDVQREQLRALAAASHWTLADEMLEEGALEEAASLARKAAALTPGEEVPFRRLLVMLDAVGDRAAALTAYDDFARYVRRAFDADPSPETTGLYERIRARSEVRDDVPLRTPTVGGAAPERSAPGATGSVGAATRPRSAPAATRTARSYWLEIAFAGVGALIVSAALLLGSPRTPERDGIAIGFLDTREAGVGDAMTVIARLSTELADVAELSVGAAAESGLVLTWDEAADRSLDFVVAVVPWASPSSDWITLQVAEPGSRTVVAVRTYESGEDPALLARFVRQQVGAQLGRARVAAQNRPAEAVELLGEGEAAYAEGYRHLRGGRAELALGFLVDADSLLAGASAAAPGWTEPLLARARSNHGLAQASGWLDSSDTVRALAYFETAEALATRSLDLAGNDPLALELRGVIRLDVAQILYPDSAELRELAEADLEAGLDLYSGLAGAWYRLAEVRYTSGDFGAALLAATEAIEVDSFARRDEGPRSLLLRIAAYAPDRRMADRACREGRLLFDESFVFEECDLFLRAWGIRDPDPTLATREVARLDTVPAFRGTRPLRLSYLAAVHALAGDPDSARAVLQERRGLEPGSASVAGDLGEIRVLALLGDSTEALRLLRQLSDRAPYLVPRFPALPELSQLRDEPGFLEIVDGD